MNQMQIKKMIMDGKQGRKLHLSARHHLDKLKAENIPSFLILLKRYCSDVTDLSLEDLTVNDQEAAVLVSAVNFLALEHFSLQGAKMGDECVKQLHAALKRKNNAALPSFSSAEVKSDQESVANSVLKSLVIGGYAATDESLLKLTTLLTEQPTLMCCSVNWSPLFSIRAALAMVKKVAVNNISLKINNQHGFFHSIDILNIVDTPGPVHFINGFFKSIVLRNNHLAFQNNLPEAMQHYRDFFNSYNQTIKEGFLHMQFLYDFYGLPLKDFLCQPLEGQALRQLLLSDSLVLRSKPDSRPVSASNTVSVREGKEKGSSPLTQASENLSDASKRVAPNSTAISAPASLLAEDLANIRLSPASALVQTTLPVEVSTSIFSDASHEIKVSRTAILLPPSAFTVASMLEPGKSSLSAAEYSGSQFASHDDNRDASSAISAPLGLPISAASSVTLSPNGESVHDLTATPASALGRAVVPLAAMTPLFPDIGNEMKNNTVVAGLPPLTVTSPSLANTASVATSLNELTLSAQENLAFLLGLRQASAQLLLKP